MKLLLLLLLLLLLSMSLLIFSAEEDEANYLPYDYSATIECVKNPPTTPLYNGGILQLVNPQLLQTNNISILSDTPIFLEKELLYTFSAWVQLRSTTNNNMTINSSPHHQGALVSAVFETPGSSSKTTTAGWVLAQPGCWSMLKGGLTVDSSGSSFLHFRSNDTSTNNLLITTLSLQPFTQHQWTSHQTQSIQTIRKTRIKFKLLPPLTNITITLKKLTFPFGVAINKNILTNPSYKTWFTSRPFTVTAFEDEMKWYTTEPSPHHLDYSSPDSLLAFVRQHNLQLRGHNILWDDPRYQPGWVNTLSPNQLRLAAHQRIDSLISKYRQQVISWDVVNENLHFSFFEDRLGTTASDEFYKIAKTIDTTTRLFLNDYNTIEESTDAEANPAKYIAKLKHITRYLTHTTIGIGLESHFPTKLNLPYMRASLDLLAATSSPIWLTEVDVLPCSNQPQLLEQILREAHSHPSVQGIVIWSAWKPNGCYRMCLTDNNFTNLPTGDVVDKLMKEWGAIISPEGEHQPVLLTADDNGFIDVSLFHGEYQHSYAAATLNNKRLFNFRVDADGCTRMDTLNNKDQPPSFSCLAI